VKSRLLSDQLLQGLAERHGTPLFVYRAETVLERARELLALESAGRRFDRVRYAQKANPNLSLLRLMRSAGLALDAVSAGEIERALAAGYAPVELLFCADLLDEAALERLARLPIQLNAGSPDMLDQYAARQPPRRDVCLRVNPGFGHGHDRKVTTGGEGSKHGLWHADLEAVARRARELGLEVRGLHVHIGSGVAGEHLTRSSGALREAARHFAGTLRFLSAGGGLPIPYRAGEARVDLLPFLGAWNAVRCELEQRLGREISLEIEPGRYLVAEAGLLLARVRSVKRCGNLRYVLVDAGFHNLIRPAMYGAYHEISRVGPERAERLPQVLAGPLCESADVFTVDKSGAVEPRELPRLEPGDLVCLHDAGAYASAMASNYNSQPLAAEVLVRGNEARLIRPRQRLEELFEAERGCLP
jgi:diaminopimelate decarboxylase